MTEPTTVPPGIITAINPGSQETTAQLMTDLRGRWVGEGINTLWVPSRADSNPVTPPPMYNPDPSGPPKPQPRFVASRTTETLVISEPLGDVPNKGAEDEINESASAYSDHVYDENGKLVHAETGFWLGTPVTSSATGTAVGKLAAIPHGTTVLAQGPLPSRADGTGQITAPAAEPATPATLPTGMTAPSGPLDPVYIANVALYIQRRFEADRTGLLWQFELSSGGADVANISFLKANAPVTSVRSTYWIGNLGIRTDTAGAQEAAVLAYVQVATINFDGIDWPHVSVGYLLRDQEWQR